jgi:iron(III) transport system substrate-binding protein
MSRLFIMAIAILGVAMSSAKADVKALEAAAAAEKEITWYVSYPSAEDAELTARRFMERYPSIKVNVVRATAQVIYQRLQQDLKNGIKNCDVFETTDVGQYVSLRKRDLVAKYVPEATKDVYPDFRDLDPQGYYHIIGSSMMTLMYNTKLVKLDDAPKSWKDLLDPKWKSKISTGSPAYSGFLGVWVVYMQQLYGWEYLDKFKANLPLIGRSSIDPTTHVSSGERQVAGGPAAIVEQLKVKGAPIDVIYPTDGSILMYGIAGVLANAPHPNAARLWQEFRLGKEANQIQIDRGGESLRPDGVIPAGRTEFRAVKIYRPKVKDMVESVPEAIEKWRDIFGG